MMFGEESRKPKTPSCWTHESDDNFRVADNPGVGPLMTTRAFVGTNPTDD
jgi:hypothetical protein